MVRAMRVSPESLHWARHRVFAQAAALLSIALGGVVLIGWWANIESLRSVIPGSTSLKPNIAAGFLLCGAVLMSLARKKVTKPIAGVATVLATTVIVLGALTLVEHFFNWNLGIDTWLVREFPAVMGTSHPGRMLPATAFCFVLTGSALFAEAQQFRLRLRFPLVGGLSTTLVIIGVLALGGFLLEMLFGARWNLLGMSITGLSASAGFLILGGGLLALLQSKGELTWSLDVSTTAGFAFGILLMVVTAGAAFTFARQMLQTNKSINDRQEILEAVQRGMTGTAELLNSQRLYVIAGAENSLKEREQMQASVAEQLRNLRKFTAASPNQQRRLDRLGPMIEQRIEWEERVIAARRHEGSGAAAQMVESGRGVGGRPV